MLCVRVSGVNRLDVDCMRLVFAVIELLSIEDTLCVRVMSVFVDSVMYAEFHEPEVVVTRVSVETISALLFCVNVVALPCATSIPLLCVT